MRHFQGGLRTPFFIFRIMFRMNGISRVSTWMCGAIVSVLHSISEWAMPSVQGFLSDFWRFRNQAVGALGRVLSYRDSLKHIHVSLDTRLPASYGPGKTIPAPASASLWCIYQKPLTFAYVQSRGCALPYFRTVRDRSRVSSATGCA